MNALKKAIKADRMAELAAICYADFCRAATYVSKDGMTTIHQMVPDIETELVDKLFDPHRIVHVDQRVNSLGVNVDHEALMADCIIALFRLDAERTVDTLLPFCFGFTAPMMFRTSVVKAAVAIASEGNKLPWIASVSTLHRPLCSRIRTLFLENFQREAREKSDATSQTSRKTGTRPRRDTRAVTPERFELTLDILHLYQTDPRFAILGDDSDRLEQNAPLLVAITKYTNDSNSSVREAAADCLTKLHDPDSILFWGPSDFFMESFWKISSQVQYTLAKQLLGEKDQVLKNLLELLKQLLTLRNEFLEKHCDSATKGIDTPERWKASVALEVALLILLCSSDTDICTLAIDCFGLLCTEVQLTESFDEYRPSSTTIVQNIACYTELAHQAGVVTGRKSQQRRIRQLLRTANRGSHGVSAAWEEAWKRWKLMTPLIIRPAEEGREDTPEHIKRNGGWQDKLRNTSGRHVASSTNILPQRFEQVDEYRSTEWQNYAGFLVALGGVCYMTTSNDELSGSQISGSSSSGFRSIAESTLLVEKFMMEMVDLLACDHLMAREWVREIIGNDLSPTLYHIMFRGLEETISQCFPQENKTDPVCGPRYTLFVEQAVSVLKLTIERLTENAEALFMVDFSNIISLCAFYVNKLPKDAGSMKMKIKLCQLIEVMIAKKDHISLRQEFKLRNKLLGIIAEWTSDYSLTKVISALIFLITFI